MAAALALPFAPVWTERTTLTWPAPGAAPVSSTAFLAPYRPIGMSATVPCSALRAANSRGTPTTVLATAAKGAGLLVRVDSGVVGVSLNAHLVTSVPVTGPSCGLRIEAGPRGTEITSAGRTVASGGSPLPVVQMFSTELAPDEAQGLTVSARTSAVFDAPPTGVKNALIGLWAVAAALALGWLWWRGRVPVGAVLDAAVLDAAVLDAAVLDAADTADDTGPDDTEPDRRPADALEVPGETTGSAGPGRRPGRRGRWWPGRWWPGRWWWPGLAIDAGVVAVAAVWAVIGPLSDDDGFAAMIARNSRAAGFQGNYYRWWNASETPFALAQHLLAPLTSVSVSPLWLRLPSTALAVLTWLLLSRGVLPAALPGHVRSVAVRVLAAGCFLACWLPFNLGVRPEAYVACGLTALLALVWRARTGWTLGVAALVLGLTVPASPAAVLLLAPPLVWAPRVWSVLTAHRAGRGEVAARVAVLACLAALALVVVFADQSWNTLAVATRWHTAFGPSLPWYDEFVRYQYLLSDDQDGSATKRLPVLLAVALLPVVALLLARGGPATTRVAPGAGRSAAVVSLGLALLWLTPSKWSHYFGALAGPLAAFLTVSVVLLVGHARPPGAGGRDSPGRRAPTGLALAGTAGVALAAGVAFSGPNAWWQPVVYDVPWAAGPVAPAGMPLNSPALWAGLVAVSWVLVRRRRGPEDARRALIAGPAVLAATAVAVSVAVLLGSFALAPLRRPAGSLAVANLRTLDHRPSCGLGGDVRVLPDVAGSVMTPAPGAPGVNSGFSEGGGYDPAAPPPEPAGRGASTQLWGSLTGGSDTAADALNTATLTTPWFTLPSVAPGREVTVSVSGRTGAGNSLALEFGRAAPDGTVTPLGRRTPPDPVRAAPDEDPDLSLWRAVGVPASAVPPGSDRVRIRAVDATSDPDGWLAVTGPRLREDIGLPEFLRAHSPVLIAWPIAFLFPCVTDVVTVSRGLAQAPVSVLEAPRRYSGLSAATTDATIGGTYAPLRDVGGLGQVTTRLAGHPELDWGDLLLTAYPAARDTYRATVSWTRASGLSADDDPPTPPVRAAGG